MNHTYESFIFDLGSFYIFLCFVNPRFSCPSCCLALHKQCRTLSTLIRRREKRHDDLRKNLLSFAIRPPIKMLVELLFAIAVISCISYGFLWRRFNSKIDFWRKMGVVQNENIKVQFRKLLDLKHS